VKSSCRPLDSARSVRYQTAVAGTACVPMLNFRSVFVPLLMPQARLPSRRLPVQGGPPLESGRMPVRAEADRRSGPGRAGRGRTPRRSGSPPTLRAAGALRRSSRPSSSSSSCHPAMRRPCRDPGRRRKARVAGEGKGRAPTVQRQSVGRPIARGRRHRRRHRRRRGQDLRRPAGVRCGGRPRVRPRPARPANSALAGRRALRHGRPQLEKRGHPPSTIAAP